METEFSLVDEVCQNTSLVNQEFMAMIEVLRKIRDAHTLHP